MHLRSFLVLKCANAHFLFAKTRSQHAKTDQVTLQTYLYIDRTIRDNYCIANFNCSFSHAEYVRCPILDLGILNVTLVFSVFPARQCEDKTHWARYDVSFCSKPSGGQANEQWKWLTGKQTEISSNFLKTKSFAKQFHCHWHSQYLTTFIGVERIQKTHIHRLVRVACVHGVLHP